MRVLQLARGAFWTLAAMALAACDGSRSFDGSFGPSQNSAHIVTARGAVLDRSGGVSRMGAAPGRSGGASWMDPEAKAGDLMYVSSYPDDAVYVYTYPALKKAGKLTYLSYPDGICTDKKGNVFVVNNRPGKGIVEYAHGGKSPIGYLDDGAEYAVSCDVDPVTGNVAVSNYDSVSYDPGSVAIYPKAQNNPTYYTDPNISVMLFCGYDNKGNLFVDGLTPAYENFFAELPKGKSKFTFIDVKGGASQFGFPGTIRWDGTHVVVGNQQLSIYWKRVRVLRFCDSDHDRRGRQDSQNDRTQGFDRRAGFCDRRKDAHRRRRFAWPHRLLSVSRQRKAKQEDHGSERSARRGDQ